MAVDDPIHGAVISEPGAKISTHDPKFEKELLTSFLVVAPTVIACGDPAGDCVQASVLEFPAATTTVTPV